jgi:hypothetical protein
MAYENALRGCRGRKGCDAKLVVFVGDDTKSYREQGGGMRRAGVV